MNKKHYVVQYIISIIILLQGANKATINLDASNVNASKDESALNLNISQRQSIVAPNSNSKRSQSSGRDAIDNL